MTALLSEHVDLLAAGAIPAEVAKDAGAYSVTNRDQLPECLRSKWGGTGIVFLHHPLEGDPVPQYRPDTPAADTEGKLRKYLFPTGETPLNIVPAHRDRLSSAATVLMVEGTKQTLAAVAAAPDGVVVVGVAGCWGWSRDGVPNPELSRLGLTGRRVVVAFDRDVDTNPKVYDAADRLARALDVLGAESVDFLRCPAGAKAGLDDYLAATADDQRQDALERLLRGHVGALGRRPRSKEPSDPNGPSRFFDRNGLMVVDVVEAVLAAHDLALAPDGSIWQYGNGVYQDTEPMVGALRDLLGNRYRPLHRKAVEEVVADVLRDRGLVLGDRHHADLVNVKNGMLEVATGKLLSHDPKYLSRWQLSVAWKPDAHCPTFDTWLPGRVGDQSEALLEAIGLVLCPWVRQRKTVFFYGPQRSGKSTLCRLLEGLVGPSATASVSLHALTTNRFAAAGLYGRALNIAGDMSDHHVDDLTIYKQVTGDDLVPAERKFRDGFAFHNTALFLFTANQPPTVGESTRAYLVRIWPVMFPNTVEGSEDSTLEDRLAAELEGFLVRLVEGAQRWLHRGRYQLINPMVADDFAQQSDVAAMFASEVLAADPGGFLSGKDAFDAYNDWATANGRGRLGRNKFLARLENTLGPRTRPHGSASGSTGWRDWRTLSPAHWRDTDTVARIASFLTTSAHEEISQEGDAEGVIPREGEVGEERAKPATPDPGVSDPAELDPDQTIERLL